MGADTTADLTADDADVTAGGEEPRKRRKRIRTRKMRLKLLKLLSTQLPKKNRRQRRRKRRSRRTLMLLWQVTKCQLTETLAWRRRYLCPRRKRKRTRRDHFESC